MNRSAACGAALGAVFFLASPVLPRLFALGNRSTLTQVAQLIPESASLDVIIPSYLEAGVIASKIDDLRESLVSWPGTSRIIVIASDADTATASASADEVVLTPREGKASACNRGIAHSTADVVVLTDANCRILPVTWPRIVRSALLEWDLVSANKTESDSDESVFWALERRSKSATAYNHGSLAVAGEFLAFRRTDYVPIPGDVILDDLAIALTFELRGKATTVLPELATEEPASSGADQWERRLRMSSGLLREVIPKIPTLIHSVRGRGLLAHKVYRQTIGCAGFWFAVVSSSRAFPPVSLAILPLIGALIAGYRKPARLPAWLRPFAMIVGLQAVPPAAGVRLLLRAARRDADSAGTWEKVAR